MNEKLKEVIPYIIIIVVVVIIRSFIVTPVRVDGASMKPTLQDGEILILNKLDKNYNRMDIVVVDDDVMGSDIIKRIIGLPGEKITIRNGEVTIDDKVLDDPFIDDSLEEYYTYNLKDDEYLVLGDNRNVSKDSRTFGVVNIDDIKGTTSLRIYPFDEIGIVK